MHELSIALSIADLAAEQARQAGAALVRAIELDIGALSGVDTEALNFAMDIAFKNTLLEEAEIKINHIKAACECMDCAHEFGAESYLFSCPKCNGSNTRIIRGMEMQLRSLLIED